MQLRCNENDVYALTNCCPIRIFSHSATRACTISRDRSFAIAKIAEKALSLNVQGRANTRSINRTMLANVNKHRYCTESRSDNEAISEGIERKERDSWFVSSTDMHRTVMLFTDRVEQWIWEMDTECSTTVVSHQLDFLGRRSWLFVAIATASYGRSIIIVLLWMTTTQEDNQIRVSLVFVSVYHSMEYGLYFFSHTYD